MAEDFAGLPDESEDFAGLPAEGEEWAGLPPAEERPSIVGSLKRMVTGQAPRGVFPATAAAAPDEGADLLQSAHQVQVPLQSAHQVQVPLQSSHAAPVPQLPKIQRMSMPRGMAPTTSGGLIQAPGTDQNVALSGIATNDVQNEALPGPVEQLTRSNRAEPGTPAWGDLPEAARQTAEASFAQTRRGGTDFAGKAPGQPLTDRGFTGEAGPVTFGNAMGLISTEEEQPNEPLPGHETLFEGVPAGQPLRTRSGTPQSLREKAERDTAGWEQRGTEGQIEAGLRQGIASFLDSMGDPLMLPLMALGPAIKVVGAIAGPRAAMLLGAAVNGKFGVDIALGAKDRITNELIPAIQARDVKATTAALAQLTFEVGMLAHPAEMTDAAGKTRIGLGGLVADTARAAKGVGQVAGETLPRPEESRADWIRRKDAADAANAAGQDFPLDPVRERKRAIQITQSLIEKKFPGATVVPVEASRRVYPGVPTPAEAAAQPEGTPPALPVEPVATAPPAEFRVTKPDGSRLVVRVEQNEIQKNLSALTNGGYAPEEILSDTAKVAGTSEPGLVRLVNNVAGEDTVDHENVHEARRRGLFTDQEWDKLVALYGKGSKTEAGQEEAVARAMEREPSLLGDLRNKLGSYMAKHGIETAGAAESRFRSGEVMGRPARPGTGPSWEWGTEGAEGRWPEPRPEAGPEVARNTIEDIQAGRVIPPAGATSIPAVPEEAPPGRPLHPHEARAAEEALARGQAPLDDFLGLPPEEASAGAEPQVPAELQDARIRSTRQELRPDQQAAMVPEGRDTYGRTGAIPRAWDAEPGQGPADVRDPIERAKAEIRQVLDRDGKIRRAEVKEIVAKHLGVDISGKAADKLRTEVEEGRQAAETVPPPSRSIDLDAEAPPPQVEIPPEQVSPESGSEPLAAPPPMKEAPHVEATPEAVGPGVGAAPPDAVEHDTGGGGDGDRPAFVSPGERLGPPPANRNDIRWQSVGGTHIYLVGTRFALWRENLGGRGRPKYQLTEYTPDRSLSSPKVLASDLLLEDAKRAAETEWRRSAGLIRKRLPGGAVADELGQTRRMVRPEWRPKGVDIPDTVVDGIRTLRDTKEIDAKREQVMAGIGQATEAGDLKLAKMFRAVGEILSARRGEIQRGATEDSDVADRLIAWNVAKEQQARKLAAKRGVAPEPEMQDGPPITADDWDANPRFSLKDDGDRRKTPREYLAAVPPRRVGHVTAEEFAAMTPEQQYQHVASLQRETDTNPITGLPGRPAFDKAVARGDFSVIGQSDIDGLKWANDNLPGKYKAGTALVRAKGHALALAAKEHGTTVFHEKGDEFFVGGNDEKTIAATYDMARELLSQGNIRWTKDTGGMIDVPADLFGFSHGIGRNEDEAGRALEVHKAERTAIGLRAERLGTPPRFAEEVRRRGPVSGWGTLDDALPRGAPHEGAGGPDQPAGSAGEPPPAGDTRYSVKDDSRLGRSMAARESDRARPIHKLIEDARSAEDWKDWYQRHQPIINDLFGDDANLFRDLLAATSQGAKVDANVSLAIKAYDQIKNGRPLEGLGLGTENVRRAAAGEALRGPKIGEMQKSVHGDTDRFVIDRWVGRALFGTDKLTKEQHARGQLVGTRVAKALGWTRQQFQSALWVASKIGAGEDPGKVQDYASQLEKRADDIRALRAAFAGPEAQGAGAPGRGEAGASLRGGAETAGDHRPAWAGEPEGETRYSLKQRELFDDEEAAAPSDGRRRTETPQFKAWFADSQMRDADGKPQVVYHATTKDFEEFKPGGYDPSISGPAVWVSTDPDYLPAAHHIGASLESRRAGTRVLPLYAKIENPLRITNENRDQVIGSFGQRDLDFPRIMSPESVARVKRAGHDGILYGKEAVVFDPTQLKSATANRGEFSSTDPRLRYSIKDKADAAGNWWNDPTNVMERRSPEDIAALSPERQRIAAKIVLPRDIGEAKTFLNPFESAYQKGVRSLVSLEKVDKVTGAASGPVEQRIGAVAELASGSAARADVFINGKGAFEYGAEDAPATVESMKKILAPLGPKRVNDVRDAAVALRVMDYESRGLNSGFDPADAAAVRAEFQQNAPEVLEAAEKINRLNDAALRYFQDAGGLSDGAYNAMEYMNHFYVPFKRVFEGADVDQGAWGKLKEKVGWVNTEASPVGRTGGGTVAGASSGRPGAWKPIQRIKGGGRPVLDPITASAEHITKLIRAGDLNRVKLMLADAMEADPDGLTGIIERIPSTEHNTRISAEAQNILSNATAQGITMTPEQAMELSILSDKGLTMADNSFRVFRDGKLMEYKVAPEIAETIAAMGPQGLDGFVKLLAIPARWLRTGVTRNPAFGVFNMMRDTIDAGIQTKNGFIPILDSLRGFREAAREGGHGDIRQEWLATGAGYSSVSAAGLHGAEAMAREAMPKTRFQSILTTVRHPLEALSDLGRPFEESTRLGEFMRAKAAGKSSMEAGLDSARVTTNFTVHGAAPWVRQLGQVTAFMNPAIQGLDTMARRTKENPAAMVFKAALLLSAPSAAIWALNKDDERINELRKTKGGQLYWFVSPARTTGELDDKALIYRIPKPFLWGQTFGTGIENALDAWQGKDPRAVGEWAKGMVDVAGFNVLPTVMNEPISQYANKDLFFGTPIVQDKQKDLEPREQAGPNTGAASRWIGDKINVSPARIEHAVRGMTGGLGLAALKAADLVAPVGDVERPTPQAADNPLTGRFVARWPTTGTSSISRFYDDANKAKVAETTLKHYEDTDLKKARSYFKEKKPEIAASSIFDSLRTEMAEINKMAEMVRQSKTMTPDDKRARIDKLVLARNQLAARMNKVNPMSKGNEGWAAIFGR